MKLNNSTYDFLKWFALIAIPAFNTFILTVGKIWELPYYVQIAATLSALGVLIAALIRVSTSAYQNGAEDDGSYLPDGEEDDFEEFEDEDDAEDDIQTV